MKEEQQYMLIFRFTPNPQHQPSEDEKAEMHKQWGAFIGQMAISEKLVSTHQLGFEGARVASDKSVEDGILFADGQTMGGNMIIKANSLNEATELAKGCPILLMGGNAEVRSIRPM